MKQFESGNYFNQGHYKSFQPSFINRKWLLDDMEIQSLLSKADRMLGRLDMFSEYVPNIDMFISMHVVKEATQSSKIEGTQTKIIDAVLDAETINDEKRDDWEEVNNYILAMNMAIEELSRIPFSSRLIKYTHKTLLRGVRGKHKPPGDFRTSQNWIGGASINDAVFIPPVHTSISDYMSDLERFVHNTDFFFPDLLKVALMHYQFETVHPFLDGNGRVGRLLITLYLVDKGIIKNPVLYLSDFFERNRQLYYDNLMNVRTTGNLKQWFKFFLVGIIETAENGVDTFAKILKLKKYYEDKMQDSSRIKHLYPIMDKLYQRPVLDAQKVVELTGVSYATAYRIITEMENYGILKEISGGNRGRLFVYKEYIDLF